MTPTLLAALRTELGSVFSAERAERVRRIVLEDARPKMGRIYDWMEAYAQEGWSGDAVAVSVDDAACAVSELFDTLLTEG